MILFLVWTVPLDRLMLSLCFMPSLCFGSSKDCSNNSLPFTECYFGYFIFFHQVLNGYFVHYFAPKDLPPLPKNVVFVLDTSASMVGMKLQQVSECHLPLACSCFDWYNDLPCE